MDLQEQPLLYREHPEGHIGVVGGTASQSEIPFGHPPILRHTQLYVSSEPPEQVGGSHCKETARFIHAYMFVQDCKSKRLQRNVDPYSSITLYTCFVQSCKYVVEECAKFLL